VRHLNVENNTIDIKRWHRLEYRDELLARGKGVRVHSQRANQPLYGTANGFIIVDNNDMWLGIARDNPLLRIAPNAECDFYRLYRLNSIKGKESCILDLSPMEGRGNGRLELWKK
jgi:hypothetical protein